VMLRKQWRRNCGIGSSSIVDTRAGRLDGVAIIPARGGSKAILRKNLVEFCGFPLLSWTIAAARRSPRIRCVCVSTDCHEIMEVSRSFGAEVIERPSHLAMDETPSEAALSHACDELRRRTGGLPDVVVMLQATSPLRESAELDSAFEHFERTGLDSLFSAARFEDFLLWQGEAECLRSMNYDWRSRKRRQDAPKHQTVRVETGSFYLTRTELLLRTGNRLGGRIGFFEVPLWKSFEIDSYEGLEFCRGLMVHHRLDQLTPAEFLQSSA